MKIRLSAIAGLFLVFLPALVRAQTSAGDFSVIYGVNYSSGDRKDTVYPGWVGPLAISYRPWCPIMLGVDDDTFLVNNGNDPQRSGTGDLGFEGHWTAITGHGKQVQAGNCAASTNWALNIDYIATVPVSGTLESTELVNQFKVTYNKPLATGNFYINAGLVSSGLSSGGTTQNAIASANYQRNLNHDGTWAAEGEIDLASASKLAPSSASVLFALDAAFGKSQAWTVRFGTSAGVTPYAPKISPFVQLIFSGSTKPKQNQKFPSVLAK